jgi:hypothetical protein
MVRDDECVVHRESEVGTQETDGGFKTTVQTATDPSDIDLNDLESDLDGQLDRFTNLGSGWLLNSITRFTLHIGQYRPLIGGGSSYIPTPAALVNKRAVVNVTNDFDQHCFKWAVLSALYPASSNAHKVTNIGPTRTNLIGAGSRFPCKLLELELSKGTTQRYRSMFTCTTRRRTT